MQVPKKLSDAFYAGLRSARVPIVIDDVVEVVVGPHVGRRASPLCLESVAPDTSVLVEFADGSDAVLLAKDLRIVANAD